MSLSSADAVAIHAAIHSKPIPNTVQTAAFGELHLQPNNCMWLVICTLLPWPP